MPDTLMGPTWDPIPRNPWKVTTIEGRLVKRFPTAQAASAWLQRHGYR